MSRTRAIKIADLVPLADWHAAAAARHWPTIDVTALGHLLAAGEDVVMLDGNRAIYTDTIVMPFARDAVVDVYVLRGVRQYKVVRGPRDFPTVQVDSSAPDENDAGPPADRVSTRAVCVAENWYPRPDRVVDGPSVLRPDELPPHCTCPPVVRRPWGINPAAIYHAAGCALAARRGGMLFRSPGSSAPCAQASRPAADDAPVRAIPRKRGTPLPGQKGFGF